LSKRTPKKRKKHKRKKTKFQLTLESLGFNTYTAYLRSDHWTDFKKKYFDKHEKVCFCCGEDARDLHHTTYEHLGSELQKDVKPLCRKCHKKVHRMVKRRRALLGEAHEVLKATSKR
jgi:hypothetical protein